MAIKSDLSKGIIFHDDCQSLPPISWGIDHKTGYSMATGGNQDIYNIDPRCYMKLSNAYSRSGNNSYEMYVSKRTDYPGCCQWVRSEVMWLAPSQQTWANEWQFAAVSILIDPSWQFETRRALIAYDHKESPDDLQTPWGLTIEGDEYAFGGRFSSGKRLGKVEKGVWVDWLLHRNWKSDSSGFLKLYKNGVLVFEHYGPNADGRSGVAPICRIQHGIYKWVWASSNGQGEGTGSALPGQDPNAPNTPVKLYIGEVKFGNSSARIEDFLKTGTTPPPPPPPPTDPTTVKINAGGSVYNDFSADKNSSGGSTYSTTAAIDATTMDPLYQTERYGNFSYSIPIANGDYTVKLHFAEIYWNAVNSRLFNVSIEGQQKLSNYDIFAKAGAKNKAVIESIDVTVTDGTLNINFTTVKDNAKVSAIEVVPRVVTPPPPPPTIWVKEVKITQLSNDVSGVITFDDNTIRTVTATSIKAELKLLEGAMHPSITIVHTSGTTEVVEKK